MAGRCSADAPPVPGLRGWRADVLRFDAQERPELIADALLVAEAGRIVAVGPHSRLAPRYVGLEVTDWRGCTLAPGFVDLHVHASQLDVIGAVSTGLLDWLERHTFPAEERFSDPAHAAAASECFLDELLRNGVTTALAFCSPHPHAADALLASALRRGMRLIAGQALMDRNAPGALCAPVDTALAQAEASIDRWHGRDRLGFALSPRFAPSCTPALLAGVGELHARHPSTWIQTHLAETRDETAWVDALFPDSRSYLDVYARCGLLGRRSVFAHGLQIDRRDRDALREAGATVAVCPSSNLFLGSGLFDFQAAAGAGFPWGLGSDVGAGTSLSPFRTMLDAYQVARLSGVTLTPAELWRRHTLCAARALGLDACIGNLAPGFDADFIAIDARAMPLLARRTADANSLDDWLFALIVLGDDRAIRRTVVAGTVAKPAG